MLKLLFVVVLVTAVAQVFPSCGQENEPAVIGWVEEKHFDRIDGSYVIVINHADYEVPSYFWMDVKVGDLVKWDGVKWTIVRRATRPSGSPG